MRGLVQTLLRQVRMVFRDAGFQQLFEKLLAVRPRGPQRQQRRFTPPAVRRTSGQLLRLTLRRRVLGREVFLKRQMQEPAVRFAVIGHRQQTCLVAHAVNEDMSVLAQSRGRREQLQSDFRFRGQFINRRRSAALFLMHPPRQPREHRLSRFRIERRQFGHDCGCFRFIVRGRLVVPVSFVRLLVQIVTPVLQQNPDALGIQLRAFRRQVLLVVIDDTQNREQQRVLTQLTHPPGLIPRLLQNAQQSVTPRRRSLCRDRQPAIRR